MSAEVTIFDGRSRPGRGDGTGAGRVRGTVRIRL